MGFRDSFLRPFKKLKRRLGGGSRKPGRGEAGIAGERVNPAGSVPQSVPHVIAEDMHGREGDRTDVEGSQRTPDPGIEVVAESGPIQEANCVDGERVGRVDPPLPAPPDSNGGNLNSL